MPVALGDVPLLPLQAAPTWLWTQPVLRAPLGRPITVSWTLERFDETPVDTDTGTSVVAQVQDSAGHPVGAGVYVATHGGTTGLYTVTLPAMVNPDVLAVTWLATVAGQPVSDLQPVEVVAQRLVSQAQMAADKVLSPLTAGQRETLRTACETLFSWALGYPAVAAGLRVSFFAERALVVDPYPAGTGRGVLWGGAAPRLTVPGVRVPLRLIDGQVNQTLLADVDLVRADRGALWYVDGRPWLPGYYELHVAHGMGLVPDDLRGAAVIWCRDNATSVNLPERAAQVMTEGATILMALPTADRPTGIPRVDAVLNRYREQVVI